ncbi:SRPBCC family protein [Gordonia sp. SID5947]|uniref:SRPBCC family protein n=1 Tax=Gordonia sp. SID5947 TaxID=2690315 RepID=UPI001371415B|nr:SRPBCC family protein [Gordonia sp. SID5947]MYR07407.1 SRPBCC family protein [Gordonia sp. SID5947]
MRIATVLLAAASAVGATAVGYRRYLRQPILTWGATADEVAAMLPGDDLLPDADGTSTRAITIHARPDQIYPWLAQMGPAPRGGAYTYDWIENLLGLHMHSADHILEEFQHPAIGDEIALGPNRMRVEIAEPGHSFATRSADGNWVWAFTLVAGGGDTTRLVSRNRFRLPRLRDRIGMIPMEPGSLIMERKMLLGIKERAERRAPADRA